VDRALTPSDGAPGASREKTRTVCGEYQVRPVLPRTPGSIAAGRVAEAGEAVDSPRVPPPAVADEAHDIPLGNSGYTLLTLGPYRREC
jgi:hypothetical protein